MRLSALTALAPYVFALPHLANFPKYRTLARLSQGEIEFVTRDVEAMGPQPLPLPIKDTSGKLVNDADHPFQRAGPDDIRGPCPGLNTLASHGYIGRTGVVTPAEIITGVQEGFNLGYQFASFLVYSAFVVDGNHLTNYMTIGSNTTIDLYSITTGINTHGHFEGDVSITRSDVRLGDSINFNQTLFDTLVHAADTVGGGAITIEASAYNRKLRTEDSIARNPKLAYETPRFLGATAESGFMVAMFANNQTSDTTKPLTLDEARHFFDLHMFPNGFHRRQDAFDFTKVVPLTNKIIDLVGIQPGSNDGAGNYVVNPQDTADVIQVASLYPDPPPPLEAAIRANLQTYYQALDNSSCPQLFPYGV